MRYEFEFLKYHGCGNDFILIDQTDGTRTPDRGRSEVAKKLCDRHFSVGADGVIFIEEAKGVDGSMRLFEPAGNEADMCGNGIRCVAAYLSDRLDKSEVNILTRDGVKHIVKDGKEYRVDMGIVRSRRRDLQEYITDKGRPDDQMKDISVEAGGINFRGAIVNTGEPHIVVRTEDVSSLDVRGIGDRVNKDLSRFPTGVNLDFVEVVNEHELKVRTYERGVYDETLACGTGATAGAAVAIVSGWVRAGTVQMDAVGGCLKIELAEDGRAYMIGPATLVFDGKVSVDV